MKQFIRVNGLIMIALACSLLVKGGTSGISSVQTEPKEGQPSPEYSISVSAQETGEAKADANLTISGGNSSVKVEKEGGVTLVAGKSILLRPGTRITHGGFLYASINQGSKTTGKKSAHKLVTIEEKRKLDEQACLATAYDLFRPFPFSVCGILMNDKEDTGQLIVTMNAASGVTPEQQRKIAAGQETPAMAASTVSYLKVENTAKIHNCRPETVRVLRL